MAIIGITILLASVSYLLYKSQRSTWWNTCAQYISRSEQQKVQVDEKAARGVDIHTGNSIKGTSNPPLSETRRAGDDSIGQKEEEEDDNNSTPTASAPSSPAKEVAQPLPTIKHDPSPTPKVVPVLATPEKTSSKNPAMSTLCLLYTSPSPRD